MKSYVVKQLKSTFLTVLPKKNLKKKFFGKNKKSVFSTHLGDELCMKMKSPPLLVWLGGLVTLLMSKTVKLPYLAVFFTVFEKKNFFPKNKKTFSLDIE